MKKTFAFSFLGLLFVGLFFGVLAGRAPRGSAQTPPPVIQLVPVFSGLTAPVLLTNARDGSNRLFIIEQPGRIRVAQPNATSSEVFLDITNLISYGGERGLLGLAFHPQYRSNRRFFVNYTRRGDGATVISEFKASASNPNVAETAERVLLTVAQPYANHNGGMIEFGPDGFLYIGMGDGGSSFDPQNYAQNVDELLGKMLRIDVDTPNGTQPYSSPASNPFAGSTPGRDEIYATGLRNPWRFSFDRSTGQLWAGDVGQGAIEEIDLITLGGNYGWRTLEGTQCTGRGPGACDDPKFTPPVFEYRHERSRCSVTGGYVYRGARSTVPAGTYVFGDYCTGEIFLLQNRDFRVLLDTPYSLTSFGEDEAGELYALMQTGQIFRLAAPGALANASAANYRASLAPESVAAVFGANLATETRAATVTPLPTTLATTRVSVKDAAGTERFAPLFFISPTQVNYQVPAGTVPGTATVAITSGIAGLSNGTVNIAAVAPGVFTADASGRGLPAAMALRVRNGQQTFESIARFDRTTNAWVAVPIDLGPTTDQVFLVLFGTGFRFRSALSAVTATLGGVPASVNFADRQGSLTGVDQANILIPRSLGGRGEVDVVLTVDGQAANTVRVNIR